MRKYFPFLLGVAALVLLLFIVLLSGKSRPMRRLDERITLRQRDKIPYGTAVARQLLPKLFMSAAVYSDSRFPGSWDGIDYDKPNQAVFIIADYLTAEEDEMERLDNFVVRGNYVFIVARAFSGEVAQHFNLTFSSYFSSHLSGGGDSMHLTLEKPLFTQAGGFTYPGKNYAGAIVQMDSARTAVLGKNREGLANFIQLNRGRGRFFIHTAPLAFSNYFILNKQNVRYYRQAISVIPDSVTAISWNEYFLEKRPEKGEPNEVDWLATLFRFPAFRWGMLTAVATLGLYVLLGMRRKQRVIPPHQKPANDSLDFVKTLGRLYYDQRDHKNLAEKMGAYFLEHVRTRYTLPTHLHDEDFVTLLQRKTGYAEPELGEIVGTIQQLQVSSQFSEEQLARFHQQLELFYQNT